MHRPRTTFAFLILAAVLPVSAMDLAANLWVNADFGHDQPFIDLMLMARPWAVVEYDDPGGCRSIFGYIDNYPWKCRSTDGVAMPVDEHGWPKQVPFTVNGKQYRATAALLTDQHPNSYPAGDYVLMFEGTGEIVMAWDFAENFDASFKVTGSGGQTRHTFTLRKPSYTGKSRGAMLGIVRSDPTDNVRNIHIVPVAHADDFQQRIWREQFIDDLRPYTCIRFMDWCAANWSTDITWSDRTEPLDFPQTNGFEKGAKGTAFEYMIHLCNVTQKDCWITVPPQANDDYQTKLAQLIKERLDPSLKCYIEWSNETWNGIFWSAQYAGQQAGSVSGIDAGWCYHAYAAARLFHNFDQVFGANSTRLVKVLSGQSASSGVLGCILKAFNNPGVNTWGSKAHAIATAPYFTFGSPSTSHLQAHKSLAQQYGLDFITYEGGDKGGSYNSYVGALDVLDDYVSMFNQYTAVNAEWGAKKYCGQPIEQAGMYRAMLEYGEAHNGIDRSAPLFVKECAPWWLPASEPTARTTPAAVAHGTPSLRFDVAGRTLSVKTSGPAQRYVITVTRPDGAMVLRSTGCGPAAYRCPEGNAQGLYLVTIRGESSSVARTVMLY